MEKYKGVTVKEKKRMVRIKTETGEEFIGEVVEELLQLTTPEGKTILIPAKEWNLKNLSHAISINPDSDTHFNSKMVQLKYVIFV